MERIPTNIQSPDNSNALLDSLKGLKGKGGAENEAQMKKAAQQFESFFVSQIFDSIQKAVPENEFLGGGNEQSIFQSMFIEEVTKQGAEHGPGMGIAAAILKQMKGPQCVPTVADPALAGVEKAADAHEHADEPKSLEALPHDPAEEVSEPIAAEITSEFGTRRDPITGRHRHHSGVDLAVPMRTPLYAPEEGKVIFSGVKGGYGKAVILEHASGLTTLYAHNDQNTVQLGQSVKAGELIGFSGSSGRSTGPHLHVEVRKEGVALNPEKYVKLDKII